jgi:hypothetical protein
MDSDGISGVSEGDGAAEVLTVLGIGCRVIDLGHDLHADTIPWPASRGFSHCLEYYREPDTGKVDTR